MKVVSNCIVCEKVLSGKQRSFCSVECKNEHFLNYDVIKKRAYDRKSRLIGVSGGSCSRCGYGENIDALSFYDRSGQTLHIDTNVLANSNYEKLEGKLKDAQVLCRNCVEKVQSPIEDCFVPRNDVDFEKKFAENLAYCGIKPGQTVVLGVSGGVDSVTMLDLFAKSELKLNLIVAHMNHGVRAKANNDAKLALDLAKKYRFKFVSKTLENYSDVLENMRVVEGVKSINQEEYLRNQRRLFLLDIAKSNKADFVALAHNADDQAETFLMNAVRGSGPAGLGAMSMLDGNIVRPLLNISRAEIESYARQNKLTWHEDETNRDISYNRNYVRHRILPLLKRLNPEYLSAIGRTTHLQRQIDEHFKEEAYRVMQNVSCEHLRRLDKPLLYEVLGLLYEEVKGNRQNLSLVHLTAIEGLVTGSAGTKTLDLPVGIVVKRSYNKLDFYAKSAHNVPSAPSAKKLKIGTQKFGEWKITVESQQSAIRDDKYALTIDAEMLTDIVVRTRKPGDKIASIGKTGTKKLQDLFVDAKIDRGKRTTWPVLMNKNTNEVLFVPGLAKVKFDTKTKKLLKINIVEATDESN